MNCPSKIAEENAQRTIRSLVELSEYSPLGTAIAKSAIFCRAVKALAQQLPADELFSSAYNLSGALLEVARFRLAQSGPDKYTGTFHEFIDQSPEPYLAVIDLLNQAKQLLEEAQKCGRNSESKVFDRELKYLEDDLVHVIDLFEYEVSFRQSKRESESKGPAIVARRGPRDKSRPQVIRYLAQHVPESIPQRLALMRDLVKALGFDCTPQNVQSALEYRSRS